MPDNATRSGYVAIVGKPNVGKSTLLNHILGKKVSITSRKPQTTRQRVLGIKTMGESQLVYVDTPGLHQGQRKALNRYMNRVAQATLTEVDVILFMVKALSWDAVDEWVIKQCEKAQCPIILAINQCDTVKSKEQLLPFMTKIADLYNFKEIVPISAKNGMQVETLETLLLDSMPEGGLLFPPDQFTTRTDQFVASEFIREKLMRQLGNEIPYSLAVTLDLMEEEESIVRISAVIWIERESQKMIVIGSKGAKLKKVGTAAREDLERYFDKKVYVQLWVKVKSGWSDDASAMAHLGLND